VTRRRFVVNKARSVNIMTNVVGLFRNNVITSEEKDHLIMLCQNAMVFNRDSYFDIIRNDLEMKLNKYKQGSFERKMIQETLMEV
jgi:hypothetical protein